VLDDARDVVVGVRVAREAGAPADAAAVLVVDGAGRAGAAQHVAAGQRDGRGQRAPARRVAAGERVA